jgi:hypothetical protein
MALFAGHASASLVSFQTYTGNVAVSTDGWGGLSNAGVISASVPAGSTIVAAYLYTATQNFGVVPTTVTFNGNPVTYDASFPNATACCTLASYRVDVTAIVQAAVGGGGGVFDFNIAEGSQGAFIDGSALVVVYQNASLPEATVGILDGFASVTGDTTSINFANPLDPTDPAFFAEMALGINFSCCDQKSVIEVNGQLLTENAGNNNDGVDLANGSLITVGSFDDPFSPLNPSYAEDTERYDLSSFVTLGDTSLIVDTFNASEDDNIFLATFYVAGIAGVNEPPPPSVDEIPLPAAAWVFIAGIASIGAAARRRKKA